MSVSKLSAILNTMFIHDDVSRVCHDFPGTPGTYYKAASTFMFFRNHAFHLWPTVVIIMIESAFGYSIFKRGGPEIILFNFITQQLRAYAQFGRGGIYLSAAAP